MVIDPRIAGWFAGKAAKILGVALGLAIWLGSYFGVYLMGKAIGELRNAITNKGPNPSCDLSDDELLYFRELAEATGK